MMQQQSLLIIMVVILILVFGFFCGMLYEIWIIERNKVDILTLYSFLHFEEIREVYDACDKYMSGLNRGSMLQDLQINKSQVEEQEMGDSVTPDAT